MVYQKAPRLFTGAFFPEEVSRGLQAFSQRHHLKSHVWIPKKLVGQVKKGSALLPNAILCDVALMPGGGSTGIHDAIGFDHILVNAEHTTDADYFESYSTEIALGNGAFLPLSATGAPIRNPRATELTAISDRLSYKSPYWFTLRDQNRRWINAEETHRQGIYNPTDCVFYEPHTYTNQLFPPHIALLMRRKASQLGYVSRTWLTAYEGEQHGSCLHPERMLDGAPVFVGSFSGHGRAVEYFCADQFVDPSLFPTSREIDLAASGVFIGAEKVRGYPLLASLAMETDPATRHRRIEEETQKLSCLKLWGISADLGSVLLGTDVVEKLRRFALLRGFTRPHFVSSTSLAIRYLPLKPQEQGLSIQLHTRSNIMPSTNRFCWFNTEQFIEPSVAEEIEMRSPMYFTTNTPIMGKVTASCARAQLLRKECSTMWVLQSSLKESGGQLKPGAVGIPISNNNSDMLYNMCDISFPGRGSQTGDSSSSQRETQVVCDEADTSKAVNTQQQSRSDKSLPQNHNKKTSRLRIKSS